MHSQPEPHEPSGLQVSGRPRRGYIGAREDQLACFSIRSNMKLSNMNSQLQYVRFGFLGSGF